MNQIWLVTKREYLVQVRKKSFILLTIFTPLLLVALIALVVLLSKANEEINYTAVVDESGLFTNTFKSNEFDRYAYYPVEDLEGLKDTLNGSEYLQAILHIPKTDSTFSSLRNGVELSSNKSFGITQIISLQNIMSSELERINLSRQGITEEALQNAKVPIKLMVQKDSDSGSSQTNQLGEGVKTALSYILMYSIFMFIMIYAVRVMRSVIEEKNNRVVEIIISSVKPFNLMLGKILGTTFVALTQFIIWIIIILVLMSVFPLLIGSFAPSAEMMGEVQAQTQGMTSDSLTSSIQDVIDVIFNLNIPMIIISFLTYFFCGYLLYSSFFAAIGASVDNETETQQFMWVGLIPLMLGLYGAFSIIQNPDGPVGFWLSMVPFTSPIAMMARISYGVPLWELLLSIAILIATVLAMVWFAAKIYRIGILMYGKKPSFKEWLKWLKY